MKKFITLILAFSLALTLTACEGNNTPENNNNKTQNETLTPNPISPDETNEEPKNNQSDYEIIRFGGYDWLVLDVQDGKALIISKDILSVQAYHLSDDDITWEQCDLRQYLNGEFLNNSFSPEERERIAETTVINNDNPEYGTAGGSDTTDKMFLLSIEEADDYFAGDADRIALNANGGASLWWLRSPGAFGNHAAIINYDGYISVDGYHVSTQIVGYEGRGQADGYNEHSSSGGVRPALWLNLE
ncbi:MAG: DUF6273 domain-containing protein [Oscillospiraceae bacterium]|nr:DUF6273 domain-containing protein [Oscillospiraceae bacterium]